MEGASTRRAGIVVVVLAAIALAWWLWPRAEPPEPAVQDASDPQSALRSRTVSPGEAEGGDVPPWDRPRASISGTVRAAKQPVVAQVCVIARGEALPAERKRPRCTKSGRDGRYHIEDLDPVATSVAASAATFLPGEYRENDRNEFFLAEGEHKQNVDIEIEPGGVELRGVVRDISGGEIEGAIVTNGSSWWARAGGFAVTRTDENGEFTLWVPAGQVALSADADGYTRGGKQGIAPGYFFEIPLVPESVLVGRVVQVGTQTPVADVQVRAKSWGDDSAYTDENGRFRIVGLYPGRYKPIAKSDRGWGEASTSALVGLGETSEEILIELHPAVTVQARLVIADSGGQPCRDGAGTLKPTGDVDRSLYAKVGSDGVLEWQGVFPGSYETSAWCRDHVPGDDFGRLEVADRPIADLVWEVKRGRAIRGRVVGPGGEAVPRGSVNATMTTSEARAQRSDSWGQDIEPDGTFEITGLLPGSYALGVHAEDLPSPTEPVKVEVPTEGDVDGVVIELGEGARIVGRVVDADAKPIGGAMVGSEGVGGSNRNTVTDDDGRFALEGLAAGSHRVMASLSNELLRGPGRTDDDVQGETVTVVAGEEKEIELVVEARAGQIRGRVVDDAGGPIIDAFVHAQRESDSSAAAESRNIASARWGEWSREPVLTDQNGAFVLRELTEGRYTLRAYRKGGGEGFVEHVAVGSEGVVVALEVTGTIEGKIVGGAPERFEVTARVAASGFHRREGFFRTRGVFVIDALPPGTYELTVESDAGDGRVAVDLAEGDTRSGIEVELQRRVVVKGKLVDVDTGQPVPGVAVMIGAKGGDISFDFGGKAHKNVSDDSGAFEVESAPVGSATLTALPRGFGQGEYTFMQRAVTIPDEDPAHLPDVKMVARRVRDNERAGDLGFTLVQAEAGVDWTDRKLVVGFVRPGGPAATAGLRQHDEIVAVDTHDVAGENGCLFETLTQVLPGTTLTLKLADSREIDLVVGPPL